MTLELKKTDRENLLIGTKINGKPYTVRNDRHRYFFPNEWKQFINSIKNKKHYFFFLTCLHTGGRAMEILHLKVKDIDFERSTVTFNVVKQRKAKKQFYALGKARTFFVSDKYIKEMKAYLKKINAEPEHYIFLNNESIPKNYDNMTNKEKKSFYKKTEVAYNQLLKRRLKAINLKDYYNFSLHNLRKTYGNWMRIFDIKTEEICYRLGHDLETYMAYYGSNLIFTQSEKIDIMNIMGSVK